LLEIVIKLPEIPVLGLNVFEFAVKRVRFAPPLVDASFIPEEFD